MQYQNTTPIHSWRLEDRPREKLSEKGVEACTDAELLAMILRTGDRDHSALDQARFLLEKFNSLNRLSSRCLKELKNVNGIGPAKATALLSAFELGRRIDLQKDRKTTFNSSALCARYFRRRIGHQNQEFLYALFLNNALELVGESEISKGGINFTQVDQRILFKEAILLGAPKIIIGHNHPSGLMNPSLKDDNLTNRLCKCAIMLDLRIMDHVIVGPESGYYSYADSGRMPNL